MTCLIPFAAVLSVSTFFLSLSLSLSPSPSLCHVLLILLLTCIATGLPFHVK